MQAMAGRLSCSVRNLLFAKTDRTEIQLLRSAAAAHLGFWADFAVLASLTEIAGLYYLLSAGIGFTAGVSLTYVLSVFWIFRYRRLRSRIAEFAAFCLIAVIGAGLMLAAIWFLTEIAHLHYLISKIVSSLLVFMLNFTLRRTFLFRRRGGRNAGGAGGCGQNERGGADSA